MPGITGIVGNGRAEQREVQIQTMLRPMLHGSFYKSGTYACKELGVWIAWTALEDDFSAFMPVWNENQNICLILSGEEFSDSTLRHQLATKGHRFNSGNADYLVHLYEDKGTEFLAGLNGFYSGLIIDTVKGELVLFNDRYGINRIYFHQGKENFYFSSEAKSILAVVNETRRLDPQSMGDFFSCGCVLQDRSLFAGIEVMPGGSCWTFRGKHTPRKRRYFKPEMLEGKPILDPAEYYRDLKEVWVKALPRYFRGRQAMALSLTGGIDSRLILAYSPLKTEDLPCFTFGGPYRDCIDVTVSREIAQLCGHPHYTLNIEKDFFESFPDLVERSTFITDGTMDPSGAADLYWQQKARQVAAVRITGLNGGELLRGLIMFKPWQSRLNVFTPDVERHTKAAAARYNAERQCNNLSFVMFKQAPWHLYNRLSLERSQMTIRSPYFDNDLVSAAYRAPQACLGPGPGLNLILERNPLLGQIETDRAFRATAIPGITSLRRCWKEITFKAEYAFDYGMPPWLVCADRFLAKLSWERAVLGRHKNNHFRLWYKNELSDYVRSVLLDRRSLQRDYINRQGVVSALNDHIKGAANATLEIHKLLTLELVSRLLLDR